MRAAASFAIAIALGLLGCAADAPVDAVVSFDMAKDVASGEELHVCQFVRMPEAEAGTFVSGGDYATSDGTHHFLLFRTAADMPAQRLDAPMDCYEGDGVMQYERGYVSGGQQREESAEFPGGLALAFAPGEILMLQGHFLNTSSEAVHATVHVDLKTVDPASVLERVGTFRFYDPFIYVPAYGRSEAAMRCHIHHDVTLISGGSHMHARGTSYRAFVDPAGEAPGATPFYTTTDWQHPVPWEGATALDAGASIRFGCSYENPDDRVVTQGLSAVDDEMCMFSGFYFPAQDDDEDACTSMDMHGTGDRSCAQTNSCLSLCEGEPLPDFSPGHADVGPCFQQCIVDSCPDVTESLFPELRCAMDKCPVACASVGAECSQCIAVNCKEELDACQALSCGQP